MSRYRECAICGAALDPGEVCDCMDAVPEENTQILELAQAPIIYENLSSVRENMDSIRQRVYGLPLTEESLKEVKDLRAQIRKQFDELEEQRKAVKKAVMEPYDRAEKTYKECITAPFSATDNYLKSWIDGFQDNIKHQCEQRLREYFAELCQSFNIDFLRFEDCGVKVDMAMARQKEPRKAMDQIYGYVNQVQSDVETIMNLDHAAEVFAEYRKRLNLADTLRFLDEQKQAAQQAQAQIAERRENAQAAEEDKKALMEAVPEIPQEEVYTVTFAATGTLSALKRMKSVGVSMGITFEEIEMEE